MTRTLLIDGDVAAYQFGFIHEEPINWGDGLWTLHANAERACANLDGWFEHTLERLGGDKFIIALTDRDNWRYDILPSYKANRKDQRKPVILNALKEHMREKHKVFERPRLEGDDVLGILATSNKIVPGEKVIVSIDKDMRTVPGKLANLKRIADRLYEKEIATWEEGIEDISEEGADWYHMVQTLAGDVTDGYTGIPGVGAKKAEAILRKATEELHVPLWAAVCTAYCKAGLGLEEALRQARVARILRNTDYDFKKKEVILWIPKQLES